MTAALPENEGKTVGVRELGGAKPLPPEAARALAEAEARRSAAVEAPRPREIGGRAGPEPTRYGDWEKKGVASDF